jgi:hypothetical protein
LPKHGVKKTVRRPKSVIDKWLFYDRTYTPQLVTKILEIKPLQLASYMSHPRIHFTIHQMERIAPLVGKDIVEVFWACYIEDMLTMAEKDKLDLYYALQRNGIL